MSTSAFSAMAKTKSRLLGCLRSKAMGRRLRKAGIGQIRHLRLRHVDQQYLSQLAFPARRITPEPNRCRGQFRRLRR